MIKCLLRRVGRENPAQVKDGLRFRVVPIDRFHRLGHLHVELYLRLCSKMTSSRPVKRPWDRFHHCLQGGVPWESFCPRTALLGHCERQNAALGGKL